MMEVGEYLDLQRRRAVALKRAAWREADALGEKMIVRRRTRPSTIGDREAARAEHHGLRPGSVIRVVKAGTTLECTWEGPRRWVFAGVVYKSITAAACAAMPLVGLKADRRGRNGWEFWGLEKQSKHWKRLEGEL